MSSHKTPVCGHNMQAIGVKYDFAVIMTDRILYQQQYMHIPLNNHNTTYKHLTWSPRTLSQHDEPSTIRHTNI